ncbi:unnamed protein product [Phyllotreta striolata]|uniref:Uncharacterized protein n=1 Tax=Phyllotreta striolata TaxID=444603 RepID=A0A9N9XMQ4_PHYSR|nr:unnamed protein product [Phyllotreta striolata]
MRKRDVNDWGNWLTNKMGNVVHQYGSDAADKRYQEIVIELTAKNEELEQMQIYKDIKRLEEELLAYTNAGIQQMKNKLQNFRDGIFGRGGKE